MLKASRIIADLLRSSAGFGSGLAAQDQRRILDGAALSAQTASRHLGDLRTAVSNNLIERNREYYDDVSAFLTECCEGIIGCHQVMASSFGRDDSAFYRGATHLAGYLDLVGAATGSSGMSPHALVGIPWVDDNDFGFEGIVDGPMAFANEELHVITDACADVLDLGCVEACPVDCIYIGDRMAYIHPYECIECGDCAFACPVGAIFPVSDLPEEKEHFTRINAEYFSLSHSHAGSPGGADAAGRSGVDHPEVMQSRRRGPKRSGSPAASSTPVAPAVPARSEPSRKPPKPRPKPKPKPKPGSKPAGKKPAGEAGRSAGSPRKGRSQPPGRLPVTSGKQGDPAPDPVSPPGGAVPSVGGNHGPDMRVIPESSLRATARRLVKRDDVDSAEELLDRMLRFYEVDSKDRSAAERLEEVAEEVWTGRNAGGSGALQQSGAGCMSAATVLLLAAAAAVFRLLT